jgi:cell division septation protein DedD
VDEPLTHYQISFTSRQALFAFAGLLLALAGAYWLGLLTGLPSREQPAAKAVEPTPSPQAIARLSSGEARRPPARTTPVGSVRETSPVAIQFFEDRGEEPTPSAATPSRPTVTAAADRVGQAERFWVQVVSLRSQTEARQTSARLQSRRYRASVIAAQTPRGTLYRVRVGPFSRHEEADRIAQKLKREEKLSPWVVGETP